MSDDVSFTTVLADLKSQVNAASIPIDLKTKIGEQLSRLSSARASDQLFAETERLEHYLDWVLDVPWTTTTVDNLDLPHAQTVLNEHHYGLQTIKDRLLEYLSVLKLNHDAGQANFIAHAPIILLVGLVGTGKTTFAYSLAEAMGRKIVRVPFGSLGSALDLRGQSRLHAEAEPGQIIKALIRAGTRNPIILLDEIDRVAEDTRNDIMGVLVELLDPEQNHSFLDYYLDYPVDLSQVLFIGTANGTSHIATAVLDRMEPLSMPSYTDEEKIQIAKAYLFPKIMTEVALPSGVLTLDDSIWPILVRPLGYDAGLRTLKRTLQGVVRKVAREYVEGKLTQIQLTADNLKPYLPSFSSELI
jgi:ATP-dependent Lon protease